MRYPLLALAFLACAVIGRSQSPRPAPSYSADSIVNLASGERGRLAPNTLAAIYGRNLAPYSRARVEGDLKGGVLPYQLPGTGVTVKVSGLLAPVEYISPEVVTFLVPSELRPGPATIVLTYNSLNGPIVRVQLAPTAPAWFLMETGLVLGRHRDSMEWIDHKNPARPGEAVIVYAAGLGDTEPVLPYREFPRDPVPLAAAPSVRLTLAGRDLDPARILYIGLTPGFPGVYQVDLVLPDDLPQDPELVLEVSGDQTASGACLRFQPTPPQPDAPPLRSTR
ncbi:hypothetical protein [uncultured Paludibaculum sp.]|uniref:hypothetical protein n=1 Tax=uncultured Paludibaculum sp. TaxID=1765020 RepID=UPI002AAC3D1E|nr:hypothetical protein [uncultured Paludibaculum sp.]